MLLFLYHCSFFSLIWVSFIGCLRVWGLNIRTSPFSSFGPPMNTSRSTFSSHPQTRVECVSNSCWLSLTDPFYRIFERASLYQHIQLVQIVHKVRRQTYPMVLPHRFIPATGTIGSPLLQSGTTPMLPVDHQSFPDIWRNVLGLSIQLLQFSVWREIHLDVSWWGVSCGRAVLTIVVSLVVWWNTAVSAVESPPPGKRRSGWDA